jgi:hypothetical protein
MPQYSTLNRSSSQVPSAHSQRSIRHRSGAYQSSVSSPKTLTAQGFPPRDAQVEQQSNSHATATASSQSNGSHFTAIPARSRRSSIVSSRSGIHRPSLFPATSTISTKTTIDNDGSLSFMAPPDVGPRVRNDPIALFASNLPTTFATLSKSYFSHVITNIQHLAKHISSQAHSALSSVRQKKGSFSVPNPRNLRLPIISFNSYNRHPSLKNSFGLERGLTPADKLTHKWPRPRSSRSAAAPWLRSTNPFLPRSLRELRGAGGWSQGHMEAILRDSRGLGINWVGQWTFHKWCLLASVTIVFLLGLTSLVFSLLTWFAGKFNPPTVYRSPAYLIFSQFDSLPRSTYSPHYRLPRSRLAHIQLFSTFARFDGGNHRDAPQLSPHSRGLRAPSHPILPFLRLRRLSHLQESELFSRCKGQRSVAPLVLSQRSDCIARSSRLLWVERSTSRSCSIRHMLRPFSSSRLPRPTRAFRTRRSFLSRRHSIFSRAAPFDEYFGRSPLRQPRNAPFRKGYHTRALSTHSPRHIIICGIGRSSVIFGSRQTRCYETNGHTRPSVPCAERSLHFSRRQRKRDDIQASCARV